jgi:hypothetical protein
MYDPDGGPSFMYDPDLDRLVPVPKMEDAGFVAGEIRAWRVWMVAGRFLESLFNPTIWPAGKPLRAERFTDYENGIHAWRSRDEALAYGEFIGAPTEVRILGQVDLWGTVIEHERGYRAEYAQVVSLDEVIAPEPWLHEEIERIEREIDSTSWTGLARALLGRRVATTLERERRQQEKRDREEWILAQLRERYCPGV